MKVSISIVTYNTPKKDFDAALKSVLQSGLDVTVFISDNSENDRIKEWCSDPRVIYIKNESNLGFGAAHNVVLRHKDRLGDYHIIFNPDIRFESSELGKMCEYMERERDVMMMIPMVLNADGSVQDLCRLIPGPIYIFGRRFFPKKLMVSMEQKNQLLDYRYDKTIEIPFVSGCFMFLRSSIICEELLFDERFFMYFEDIDFSRRIHAKYKTVLYPDCTIFHIHASEHRINKKLLFHSIISGIKYYSKWGWLFDKERKSMNKNTMQKLYRDVI